MSVDELLASSTSKDGMRHFEIPVMAPVDQPLFNFLRALLGPRGPLILGICAHAYMCVGPFQASRDRWITACGGRSMPQASVRVRIDKYAFNVAESVVQAALKAALEAPHEVALEKSSVRDESQVRPVVCLANETLDGTTWASFTETTA